MSDTPRKVLVVLVDRANFGRLEPVMHGIDAHPNLELHTVCAGSMVLNRFGASVNVVRECGFRIDAEIFMEIEGSNPMTMAKSVGLSIMECANVYRRMNPDIVLLIGDRYEAFGAAIAAAYMNLPIVHVQGGEVSGSIDESARHAMTKLSQFHVPSTSRAREFLMRMGESEESILTTGCPSSDIAKGLNTAIEKDLINGSGSGAQIEVEQPFGLVVYHPTTTEYGREKEQMSEFLRAISDIKLPLIMLWPNIDAGAQDISKMMRVFRVEGKLDHVRFLTNFSPNNYLKILGRADLAIGNSSSFVRDAGFFGTPVVLVGNRQNGRETDAHVTKVADQAPAIVAAAEAQLNHGRYKPSQLYGDGQVSDRIVKAIVELKPYLQKRLAFPEVLES
jgi:UDP-hydrolysing UDP-N-acetyl-D-glucosamine 2-epimerase